MAQRRAYLGVVARIEAFVTCGFGIPAFDGVTDNDKLVAKVFELRDESVFGYIPHRDNDPVGGIHLRLALVGQDEALIGNIVDRVLEEKST